jgi:hypothetical protein
MPAVTHAGVIQWTDWQSSDLSVSTGQMGGVTVTHAGTLRFAQLANGVLVGDGNVNSTIDYWIERGAPLPYTGNAVVDNRPPGYELLAFDAASDNLLTFSTPVLNPIMTILSMGQAGVPVTYAFNQPFTVLSEGFGFWGDGTYSTLGNSLTGNELHAAIQFQGLVSSIQWTSTAEHWHGFTVGSEVPEPGTIGLLAAGLLGLGRRVRNRRR